MPTNHNQVPRGKKSPTVEIANPAVEAKIRIAASKPTGDLTKAQIDELKKALPKCKIHSNPKK